MTLRRLAATVRRLRTLSLAALALVLALGVSGPAAAGGFLTGQLLVAKPNLVDPVFGRTVILMIRHDRSGAMGLVVNRPLGRVPLDRLLQSLEGPGDGAQTTPEAPGDATGDMANLPVFFGGPVERFHAFTLHSRDVMPAHSVPLDDDTALNVGDDVLQALARGAGPHHLLFLLGYAGWGPGQLENELERGDWVAVKADPELIFSDEPARTWERAVARFSTDL